MRASGSRQPIIGWTTSTLSLTTWTCAANNRSLLRAISSTAEGRGRYPLPHTNTHTRRATAFSSRPVRAKGQERAAESSMPRRFFPLSNAPLPTRSPYGVNDNHDSPPRATRRPLSFDAITRRSPDHRGELPASWIFLSPSLSSSHDTDYDVEGRRRGEWDEIYRWSARRSVLFIFAQFSRVIWTNWKTKTLFYSRDFDFLESEIWINRPTTWEERERTERDDQREFEVKVRQ